MFSRLRPRLTFANVVSLLALFVALGGSGYAAFKVNGKDIKNRTITARKVKKDTLTGAEIKESKLGKVRRATNADRLGGAAASSFHDHCPSGTKRAAATLCVTSSDVSDSEDWQSAAHDCASRGMRLPSPSEALALVSTTSEGYHWTDGFYYNNGAGGFDAGVPFYHSAASSPTGTIYSSSPASGGYPVVCVTAPSNP